MPALPEQNEDLPDPYPLRSQTALPRAGFHEHCNKALHEALGDKCAVENLCVNGLSAARGYEAASNGYHI